VVDLLLVELYLRKDKMKKGALYILGSNLALVSYKENIFKIIILAFLLSLITTFIFYPIALAIWFSMVRSMYDVYIQSKYIDEYIEKVKDLSFKNSMKKFFSLFFGFVIANVLFLLVIFGIVYAFFKGYLAKSVALFLFITLIFLLTILNINATGNIFNLNCEENKIINKKCFIKGFKSLYNLPSIFRLSPFKVIKMLFVLFLINLPLLLVLFYFDIFYVSVFLVILAFPVWYLYPYMFGLIFSFFIMTFIFQVSLFYIAIKYKEENL